MTDKTNACVCGFPELPCAGDDFSYECMRESAAVPHQPAGEPEGANYTPAIRQRPFPVIWWQSKNAKPGPLTISWRVAEYAYSVYSRKYGRSQSLERLAERGGFHASELDEFLPDWREQDLRATPALPEGMVAVDATKLRNIADDTLVAATMTTDAGPIERAQRLIHEMLAAAKEGK